MVCIGMSVTVSWIIIFMFHIMVFRAIYIYRGLGWFEYKALKPKIKNTRHCCLYDSTFYKFKMLLCHSTQCYFFLFRVNGESHGLEWYLMVNYLTIINIAFGQYSLKKVIRIAGTKKHEWLNFFLLLLSMK